MMSQTVTMKVCNTFYTGPDSEGGGGGGGVQGVTQPIHKCRSIFIFHSDLDDREA